MIDTTARTPRPAALRQTPRSFVSVWEFALTIALLACLGAGVGVFVALKVGAW